MQVAASMLLILCLCNCMFFGSFKTSKGMFSLDNKINVLQIAAVILETIYFIK